MFFEKREVIAVDIIHKLFSPQNIYGSSKKEGCKEGSQEGC
jgi:hypothetical protein